MKNLEKLLAAYKLLEPRLHPDVQTFLEDVIWSSQLEHTLTRLERAEKEAVENLGVFYNDNETDKSVRFATYSFIYALHTIENDWYVNHVVEQLTRTANE